MASTRTHRLSPTLVALGRSLEGPERKRLRAWLKQAALWQRTLSEFPRPIRAPDATPYVSLYSEGSLLGCWGSHEGSPGERLGRAFLLALADPRWGGVRESNRASLEASVAYVTRAEPVRADQAEARFEAGRHGLALVRGDVATLVLPSVARERGLDASAMLSTLARKAGVDALEGIVWLVDVDEVGTIAASAKNARRAARGWLEALVGKDGEVALEIDARTGARKHDGVMRHGRIAVAIEALDRLGDARRARSWLGREIERALSGRSVAGWPDQNDLVLGTLALAARAGLDVPLARMAAEIDPLAMNPWHAGQVAAALGSATPDGLWEACVRSLDQRPFAPYVAIAARARNDDAVLHRCARTLVEHIRPAAPFVGGANVTEIPETALTAVAIEALAPMRDAEARRAVRRGRAFLARQQILDVPSSMSARALGAFRASPIAPVLRCDITAHAALALF